MDNAEDKYFEKWVILGKYVKILEKENAVLKQEIGVLKSERDELQYALEKEILPIPKADRKAFKKDFFVREILEAFEKLKQVNNKLELENRRLKRSNDILCEKIAKNQ
ncbi:MAG: hypothetical protein MUC49_02125 [Raineya sp.]|jgi:cell division protein FtsB|nr:hypothetical protein [Raineya sp.]